LLGKIQVFGENIPRVFGIASFMASSPNTDRLDARFPLYIEELREFLTQSGMPFGVPENVGPVIESLAKAGTFRGEMSSMVRSIIYRELGTIPKPELQKLILKAVGGTDVEVAAAVLLKKLEDFIDRAFINEPEDPLSEPTLDHPDIEMTGNEGSATTDLVHSDNGTEPGWVASSTIVMPEGLDGVDASDPVSFKTQQQHLSNSVYSRASAIALDSTTNSNEKLGLESPDWSHSKGELPLVVPIKSQQSYWTLGLVTVVLSMSVGGVLYLRSEHPLASATDSARSAINSAVPSASVSDMSANQNEDAVLNSSSNRSSSVTHSARTTDLPKPTSGRTASQAKGMFAAGPSSGRYLHPSNSRGARTVLGKDSSTWSEDSVSTHTTPVPTERSESPTQPTPVGSSNGMSYSSGVMSGNVVSLVPPKYPKLANIAHVEGTVILQAVVSRDGTVAATRVLSGPRLLRGAATNAVRRWRYRPYVNNGQISEVATIVTVNFRLSRH
jgi:TonB family protein